MRVVTIVGTRPEIIRLSRLVPHLDESFDHTFVHTGQNDDPNLKDVFFRDLKLRQPDEYLAVDTSNFASVMGDTLLKSRELFERLKPDAVAILGDTNSAIAAITAERMQIPVYHMEAGNRSFDKNVPEELNRRMVDHVSTFNLPYNSFSEANLLREGIQSRFIMKTGSPMREVLDYYENDILSSGALDKLAVTEGGYILASIHRQENVDNVAKLKELVQALELLSVELGVPVLVSTHPRTRNRISEMDIETSDSIQWLPPFGFLDYCKLQVGALVVVSDSGTISEESALLGFPAITPRESMERPEALEVGAMIMTGTTPESVLRGALRVISNHSESRVLPEGYEVSDFSRRVGDFISSTAPLSSSWQGLNIMSRKR